MWFGVALCKGFGGGGRWAVTDIGGEVEFRGSFWRIRERFIKFVVFFCSKFGCVFEDFLKIIKVL